MDTMPFWILFAIMIGFSAVIMLWIIIPFIAKTAEIPEGVEAYILMQRFTNSPNCFAYVEENTGKVYQKLIDWERFNDGSMNKCYQTDDKEVIAFKLTLTMPETYTTRSIKTPNWREGYIVKERQFKDIFLKYNNEVYKTRMTIDIQNA